MKFNIFGRNKKFKSLDSISFWAECVLHESQNDKI